MAKAHRATITPTLMSALTGDSEARKPGQVPKSIEVPVEIPMDAKSKSLLDSSGRKSTSSRKSTRSYEEETVTSRPLVNDMLQALKDTNKKGRESEGKRTVDEGSKTSSKKVTIGSGKRSTKGSKRCDSETRTSRCSEVKRSQNRRDTMSKISKEDTFVSNASTKSHPIESAISANGLGVGRHYLPTPLLADMHTDVLDTSQKAISQSEEKKKKHIVEPIIPQFDEFPRLLLMDMQTDDAATVQATLQRVGTLLKEEENLQEAYSLGAHVMLSMVMRKFPHDPEIQRWGCFCFSSLVKTDPKPALVVIKSGGIEALTNAMRLLPESFSVQTNALQALYNLLTHMEDQSEDECEIISNRFANDFDGLKLVVQAMSRFPNEAYLQSICCELTKSLVDKRQIRAMKTAGKVGSVQIRAEAQRRGYVVANPQFEASKQTYNVSFQHPVRPSINVQQSAMAAHGSNSLGQSQQSADRPEWVKSRSKYFGGRRKFFGVRSATKS